VVDLDHLSTFTDGEPELEKELAGLYASSAQGYLDAMTSALEAGESWAKPAHALKGASSNFGACRVARLARAAEHDVPDAARLEALETAVAEVAAFFRARRP
jgi:HPt (histidine-containing phosphotransfer) domain-containing protein